LDGNIRSGDDDGSTDTDKDLRADQYRRRRSSGREEDERHTTDPGQQSDGRRDKDLHDTDATSGDLEVLVPMGDSLNQTDNDGQTAHGHSDGV
jgi:hypothetical protein